jgi:putative ABC transport system permease protein
VLTSFNQTPVRVIAQNQFDVDTASLGSYFSTSGAWESIRGKQLAADFDNGLAQNDALGVMAQSKGLGLGELEGLITQGDSGGPAFINGLLAGMLLFQAITVGVIGYGLGLGLTALFGLAVAQSGQPPFKLVPLYLVQTFGAVLVICVLAALFGIRKVARLEPAIVFRG